MGRVLIVAIVLTLLFPAGSFAQILTAGTSRSAESQRWRLTPLLDAGVREARFMAIDAAAQLRGKPLAAWPARHPVAAGALIGAGAGALSGWIFTDAVCEGGCEPPFVLMFAGIGSGLGALIGWALSR